MALPTLLLTIHEIIPQLNFISLSHSRVDRRLFVFLLWRSIIWMEGNWYTIYRTRQILPHLPIYQIRQGTRLHSRPTPRISHRIRLTFTSLTKHTGRHCHWHAHFNNINCWSLTVGCSISGSSKGQRAASTDSLSTGRRQQQAATGNNTHSRSTTRQRRQWSPGAASSALAASGCDSWHCSARHYKHNL